MLNQLQKTLAVSAALSLQYFLEAQGDSKLELIDYRDFFCRYGNVDVRAHDDIHLLFINFKGEESTSIFAVGNLTSDAYSIFDNHEEVQLHEHVSYWKPTANHNPILNYKHLVEFLPTVELDALTNILRNGEFVINKSHCDETKAVKFQVSGVPETISRGISFETNIKFSPIYEKLEIHGYSDLDFGISHLIVWDSYHVVKDGELLDKAHVFVELSKLIDRLNLKEQASEMLNKH